MKRLIVAVGVFLIIAGLVSSCTKKPEILTETVEYTIDDITFKGYLAYDKLKTGKRPGVLVLHEWWGQNEQVRKRAEMLAELGYTALAVDMFGDAKQANNSDEAAELAKELSENPDIRRERFMAALNVLSEQETVDPDRIAAIGYSFGGNIVLQTALEGADLDGVVSFHGGLLVKAPTEPGTVKAQILILQGEKDWYVTPQTSVQFKIDMKKAGADYRIIKYEGAEHGYTNPDSDVLAEKFKGMRIKYNEAADKKSWADMKDFLEVTFRKF
jgi:dienelactone hydrolase